MRLVWVNIREAARSLYAAKQRTFLAWLGITIGIASVIAMITISQITREQALKEFHELGTDILTVTKDFSLEADPGDNIIDLADALRLGQEVTQLQDTAPFLSNGSEITMRGKSDYGNILGVTESYADLNRLRLADGRFISDLDLYRNYCVLGAAMAERMREFGARQVVGEHLRIGHRLVTVIGELEPSPSPGILPYQTDQALLIPISTAMRLFHQNDITSITARMRPGVHHEAVAKSIHDFFRLHAPGLPILVNSAEEIIHTIERQMRIFTVLTGAIGGISLLVGGVGVMNVMLVSLVERRTEIGLRRALGARRMDIQMQFLVESLILSLLGGTCGIALGIAMAWGVARLYEWSFFLTYYSFLLGVGVSAAVGIFFGFYPAYQAARLDPIAVLRSG